jgi:hypothetical protein
LISAAAMTVICRGKVSIHLCRNGLPLKGISYLSHVGEREQVNGRPSDSLLCVMTFSFVHRIVSEAGDSIGVQRRSTSGVRPAVEESRQLGSSYMLGCAIMIVPVAVCLASLLGQVVCSVYLCV